VCEPQTALGHRAGLIAADAADPSDVLDHDGAADQRLTASKTIYADPEIEGEDDRELLGKRGYGQGNGAQEGVDKAKTLVQEFKDDE
jgi:hypothetical protein